MKKKDKDRYYGFHVRAGDEFFSLGPTCDTRVEAGLALSSVLREALDCTFPPKAVLECYSAPKDTECPWAIWARIPIPDKG